MTFLPQSYANYRSPRVRLADVTPAVLRLPDGRPSPGQLETISLTGGLLSMSNMLDRGSCIKLMFLTHTGPVLGEAEMLGPVSTTQQPFRFVALEEGDQRRLRAAVQSSLGLNPGEKGWIEKYRATLVHRNPPRRGVFRVVLEALTLLTLCLGSAMYNSRSICRVPWWYSMGCLGWWCLDARQK
jgi:hypothetical protein